MQSSDYSDAEITGTDDDEYDVDQYENKNKLSAETDWQQKVSRRAKQKPKKRKQELSPSSTGDTQKKTKVVVNDANRGHNVVRANRANTENIETNDGAKPIVYIRGESIKLTTRNPFKISQDIQKTFGAVSRIESRGASLKVTCVSDEQKERVLRSTQLGDIVIATSLPNSERRKQQEATQPRHQRVVITGVPTDIDTSTITDETGASEARRIYKHDPSGEKKPTTATVLSYSCSIEDIPPRVQIGYLTFKTRT